MDAFSLFETPLFVFQPPGLEEMNDALTERLLVESTAAPGIVRANRGGWHSTPDLAHREDDCYRQLIRTMLTCTGRAFRHLAAARGLRPTRPSFSIQAWAMVMQQGDYITLHDHAAAHFSVAYYPHVAAPPMERPEAGRLTVVDARRSALSIPGLDIDPTEFSVTPTPGMVVVFPGWLQHYVHPWVGEEARVSCAANVRLALS